MRRFAVLFPAFVLVILLSGGSSLPALGQDTLLIEFEIKDQLDRLHTDEDCAGRVVIVVGFDRKGSDFRDAWVGELRDSLRSPAGTCETEVLPVATLKGVPFFLKGFLRDKFPKEADRWMLLDWKGEFTKAYSFTPDSCSILVFDPEGILRCRESAAELDHAALGRLLECARGLGVGQRPDKS